MSGVPGGTSANGASGVIVDVRDLAVEFGATDASSVALDGVSFVLSHGETLGIVGVSGSGKSVLARALIGLIREPGRVVRGSIRLRSEDMLSATPDRLTELRGSDVALIVSSPRSRLNPVLGVGAQLANVIRAKQPLTKKEAQERGVEMLASVAIGDPRRVAKSLPHELSGGMAQRVVIAMALANSPTLLIADEPTAGLDVTVQLQVLDLMKSLVDEQRAALLLMTRDLGIIAHYAQRVGVLSHGRIVEERPTQDFFKSPRQSESKHLLELAFAAHGEQASS